MKDKPVWVERRGGREGGKEDERTCGLAAEQKG
jgi:hypothetical protein